MKENYKIAKDLKVRGIVQGVGFRPFVYQLAKRHGLKGQVANTSAGVTIHVEGIPGRVKSFCHDLTNETPPLAHISEVTVQARALENFRDFSIVKSKAEARESTLLPPDMCICKDCLSELFDPLDRRYYYPFINCTNCGPRYTIIADIPYDRPKTSMKHFRMCRKCQSEYEDPGDRRFHAQPNACDKCGPHVALFDREGEKVAGHHIERTADLLKQGNIVAVKGLGGFHLAVDAENDEAVRRLRDRKDREEKPFAIMSYDLERVGLYAHIEPEEESLLTSPQRPIVLLKKQEPNPLSESVSPYNGYFGTMLPYTPLHYLLLRHDFIALVMTSGNMSEEPIAIDNEDAFARLSKIADYFLIHDREIYVRSDDSIVRSGAGETRFIRRSRGYVPTPVFLKDKLPEILACGAELKNTVCLTKENQAFLSQHIGDMENLAAHEFFEQTIDHLKAILRIEPKIIAYDLHPDYLSTRYANEQKDVSKIQVQHHHAHIVSCMAENQLEGPVIGLSFDGTGYGSDGKIWGGEVLAVEPGRFERLASMSYVPMPGGAAAIKQPWRMAVSYLFDAFGDSFWDLNVPMFRQPDKRRVDTVLEMISKKINSPETSSLGRLFDGVAAIVGIRDHVSYEGQAAMELEMLARDDGNPAYDYEWVSEDIYRILPGPIIEGVVRDVERGVEPSDISARFHATLISLFSRLCDLIRREHGLNRVVLSGGVFQNALLLHGLIKALEKGGFQVFTHRMVPTNDGGISLGQALAAAAVAKE